MVLELNASDDRGIDVVREQIKTFASTKQIFSVARTAKTVGSNNTHTNNTSTDSRPGALAAFKLIILDEADAMTNTAQMALRRIMEKYTANARFCIIANYAHKLSPALLSRCTRFRFSPLRPPDIRALVDRVVAAEDVRILPDALDALVRLSKGDMRRALNVLQACHASSTPLRVPGEDQIQIQHQSRELITTETIYTCVAAPPPDAVRQIADTLLGTADVVTCLDTLAAIKAQRGLALADLVTALAEELAKLQVAPEVMVGWMEGLADIEYRVAAGAGESVQMGALVGVIRAGVELMGRGGQQQHGRQKMR